MAGSDSPARGPTGAASKCLQSGFPGGIRGSSHPFPTRFPGLGTPLQVPRGFGKGKVRAGCLSLVHALQGWPGWESPALPLPLLDSTLKPLTEAVLHLLGTSKAPLAALSPWDLLPGCRDRSRATWPKDQALGWSSRMEQGLWDPLTPIHTVPSREGDLENGATCPWSHRALPSL